MTIVTTSDWKFFILVSIDKSCIVYFEKNVLCRYVIKIHFLVMEKSWKSHGKSLLKKSGHHVIIIPVNRTSLRPFNAIMSGDVLMSEFQFRYDIDIFKLNVRKRDSLLQPVKR